MLNKVAFPMQKRRILVIGNLPTVQACLETSFEVVMQTDIERVSQTLKEKRYHLMVVRLSESDVNQDARVLQLLRDTTLKLPKVIMCTTRLNQFSDVITHALSHFGQLALAEALLQEDDDSSKIVEVVEKILGSAPRRNSHLNIQPKEMIGVLAKQIAPDADPAIHDLLIEELDDLFCILFHNAVQITLIQPDRYRSYRGESRSIVTVLAKPKTATISRRHHPLLIKCGYRKEIEALRSKYEEFWFRATPHRLDAFAADINLAALVIPAPGEPDDTKPFTAFFLNQTEKFDKWSDKRSQVQQTIEQIYRQLTTWLDESAPDSVCQSNLYELYKPYIGLQQSESAGKLNLIVDSIVERASKNQTIISRHEHSQTIEFKFGTGKPEQLPDPLYFISKHESLPSNLRNNLNNVGVIHWELSDRHLLVDSELKPWIDGFEHLDWGPELAIPAQLEVLLKFHCIPAGITGLRSLHQLETLLLAPEEPDRNKDNIDGGLTKLDARLKPLAEMVGYLRDSFIPIHSNSSNMHEYWANLFLLTIRELIERERTSLWRDRRDGLVDLYILLSAAMLCQRLLRIDQPPASQGGAELHQPVLTIEMKRELLDAILTLPIAQDFENRSAFLSGIAGVKSLDRVSINARTDIEKLLNQLNGMGRQVSGHWPLVVFLDNILPYAEGYEIAKLIQQHRDNLQRLYSATEADVR